MQKLFRLLLILCGIGMEASGQANLTQSLDGLLAPYDKRDEPGGVVMVARSGQVLYTKAFGLANMELAVPVNDSTIFFIGSNTKQFTAVSLLQLLEKGLVQLEDSLGRFLPSCPYPVSGVRIRQLLAHTSGLGSNSETAAYRQLDRKGVTPDELVNYFVNIPMDFPAGSRWAYNNANFYVLGWLVEKLAGKTYADYVTENIFRPAGMRNTHMGKALPVIRNRASGYTNFRLGIQNAPVANPGLLYASGGIQSTVEDMLKWNRALTAGRLLKPETVRLLHTPQLLPDGKRTSYGMGFHLQDLHGSAAWRHGGLIEGFTSETLYLPAEDVYVVVLLNEETSKIPIQALSRIIAGMAIGKPYRFEEMAIGKNELPKFTGVYENDRGELVNITEQDGRLVFQRPNGAPYSLHYAGSNEFFFEKDFLRAEFIGNAAGKIASLKFSVVDIGLTEWVKTQRPPLKLARERVADSLLRQYAGRYFLAGDTLTIAKDGPFLYCQAGGQPRQLLAAESSTDFRSLKDGTGIAFVRDLRTGSPALLLTRQRKAKKYLRL